MKGISPIISIIIILFIVIAMAGVASNYLFGYWSGLTAGNIEITANYCTKHEKAHIIIKNIGTTRIKSTDFIIKSDDDHEIVNGKWDTNNYIDKGETLEWTEDGCKNRKCNYVIIAPNKRVYKTFVDCR